jgi:hypothetical protein
VVDVAAEVILDGHAEDPVAGDELLGRLLAEFASRLEADLGGAAGQAPPSVTALPTPGPPVRDEPVPPLPPPAPSREDQYASVFGSEPEEPEQPRAVPAPPEHPAPHGDPLMPEHREPPPPPAPYPEPVDPAPPHGDPLRSPEPAAALPPEPPAAPPPAPAPPAAAAPPPPPPVDDAAPTQRESIPPPGYERDAPASRAKPKAEGSPGAGLGARIRALFSRKR